jgi:hypothetical protein
LVFGKLSVVPGDESFLREAHLTVFRHSPCKPEAIPSLQDPGFNTLWWKFYQAEIGGPPGTHAHWQAEKKALAKMAGTFFSRNQLLNEPVLVFEQQPADSAYNLQEYFVPPSEFSAFVNRLCILIPRHQATLITATVRYVREDGDTFLRYADRNLFSLALCFVQARTPAGESDMQALTRELVDSSLESGGRFYLPYRPHATPEQLNKAYPQLGSWKTRKRHYDPDEIFRNQFYLRYAAR